MHTLQIFSSVVYVDGFISSVLTHNKKKDFGFSTPVTPSFSFPHYYSLNHSLHLLSLSLAPSLPCTLACTPLCCSSVLFLYLNGEAGLPRSCRPLTGCRAQCWGFCCQDSEGRWRRGCSQLQTVSVSMHKTLATPGLQRRTLPCFAAHGSTGE